MKDDLEIHEIFRAIPLYILSFELKLLIQSLKVSLHIAYTLLYLVILIRLIAKGFYRDIEEDDEDKS